MVRVWSKRNTYSLLVGEKTVDTTMENSMNVFQTNNNRTAL